MSPLDSEVVLKKYIRHVIKYEGVDFIMETADRAYPNRVLSKFENGTLVPDETWSFTDEEWSYLVTLAKEVF